MFGRKKEVGTVGLESPDVLGPRPKGIVGTKRLSSMVLVVVAVAALGLLFVLYNALDKHEQNAKRKPAEQTARAAEVVPVQELKIDDVPVEGGVVASDGVVDLLAPSGGPALGAGSAQGSPVAVGQAEQPAGVVISNTGPAPTVQSPHASAWQQYYSQRDAQQQAHYQQTVARVNSGTTVPFPKATEATTQRTGPSSNAAALAAALQSSAQPGFPLTPQPRPAGGNGDTQRAFVGLDNNTHVLTNSVQPPRSRTELKAGTVINAILIGSLNSDLPGLVQGQVTRNVYDTVSGDSLLIPQGARLIGKYENQVAYGQRRVQVAWHRIIFPDGSSIDLTSMPGSDQAGSSGFKDKVNNHYGRLFGSALAVSAFGAGVQLSQPQASNGQNFSTGQTIGSALGQQVGQLGQEIARKNLNIQPTLQIRSGYRFNVILTKDVLLPVWRGDS